MGKKDSFGFGFEDCINSGVKNPDSSVGVYAGSESSYKVFSASLFGRKQFCPNERNGNF